MITENGASHSRIRAGRAECRSGLSEALLRWRSMKNSTTSGKTHSTPEKRIKKLRPTVGESASQLLSKIPDSCDPIEIRQEMQKEYLDNLIQCVIDHRQKISGDFYVVILTKNEKLLPNVFRNYFFARSSCPTPDYDQAVFRFHADSEEIVFLWCIPSKDACIHLKENAVLVAPEERELLSCVLDFSDGTLYKFAKKLNREQADSNILQS
jgi:hypothetical protein